MIFLAGYEFFLSGAADTPWVEAVCEEWVLRIELEPIGTDVGALVVDSVDGPVLVIDPHLSPREATRLVASLLTDAEFEALAVEFMSVAS